MFVQKSGENWIFVVFFNVTSVWKLTHVEQDVQIQS